MKKALVFGGSRGIGAAIVKSLSETGHEVGYTYVSRAAEGGGVARAYKADIRDAAEVAAVFESFERDAGGAPDCVVANAGINVPPGPMANFDQENFRSLVEVNIVGAFNILQHAARHVADNGAIIGLTTSLVRFAGPGLGPYSGSKAAVECMLRSMQKELAGRGVRVNGVGPGPVDTDLFRAGKDEAALQKSAGLSVFARVGRPAEIAEVVAFLASDRASWVAGQIVQPNGGLV